MKKFLIGLLAFINLVFIWIFVFKATDNFNTSVGSDWLCFGCITLIGSIALFAAFLFYINTKE